MPRAEITAKNKAHLHRRAVGAAPRNRVRPSFSLSVIIGLAAGLYLKSFEYLLQPVTMHPYVFSPSVLTSARTQAGAQTYLLAWTTVGSGSCCWMAFTRSLMPR